MDIDGLADEGPQLEVVALTGINDQPGWPRAFGLLGASRAGRKKANLCEQYLNCCLAGARLESTSPGLQSCVDRFQERAKFNERLTDCRGGANAHEQRSESN